MDTPPVTGEHEPQEARRYGRRLFLATVAGGVSSLYWGKAAWDHVTGVVSPFANAVAPIFPSGWRIYTISGHMPVFDPAAWRLTIGGLVEQSASLTYDELRALPHVEQVSTFHCVTGWTVNDVHWGGVRIHDVLAAAKPDYVSAHALEFVSMEVPYIDYLTVQQASLPDVLLAYEMNGKPLPREHGAPVRLIIPEMYGYKGVKWLQQINLVPREELGYWEQLGYDQNAWVGRSNGYGT